MPLLLSFSSSKATTPPDRDRIRRWRVLFCASELHNWLLQRMSQGCHTLGGRWGQGRDRRLREGVWQALAFLLVSPLDRKNSHGAACRQVLNTACPAAWRSTGSDTARKHCRERSPVRRFQGS